MFLFRRKNSTVNSTSTGSGNGVATTNKRQFTFAVQVESIENIPLYMQIPLNLDLYKLNSASSANQSQMTIKGKLFRKKKQIGTTPFKLVDSSSKKSNYMTTMEFLCNIPYDNSQNCIVKGPVSSSTFYQPINEATSDNSSSQVSTSVEEGSGKFLHIVVNKKLHTTNKVDFVNEALVDLTHYCSLTSEYQCRISIPFELSRDVIANINLVIYSTIGNQLSSGRRSGSLDLQRSRSASLLKEPTALSPSKEENTSTPTTATRSPTSDVSPKVSPQVNRVLNMDFDDSVNNNNNGSITPTSNTTTLTNTSPNNNSNGMQDFFKKRAELHSGRSRAGSSPIAMQHTPQESTVEDNSYGVSDSSPSLVDIGLVPRIGEANNTDLLQQENQQLKSILQRARVRFQEVVSENSQLKDKVKQLEEQLELLRNPPINTRSPNVVVTEKNLLDFF